MDVRWTTWALLGLSLGLSGCLGCVPPVVDTPDGLPVWSPPKKSDGGGVEVLPPDAGPVAAEVAAGEPCPPESYDVVEGEIPDGAVRYGLCVALRELRGNATLNSLPVQAPVTLSFHGGGAVSEIERSPTGLGEVTAKVMRYRYDLLKYQPGGVFPTHEGFMDLGAVDMTRDQYRNLAARSHKLRGAVTLGGVPFTPQSYPADVQLEALGTPRGQYVTTSNQAGSYEVELLEGVFSLFLSSPAAALQGTELSRFLVTTQNVVLDRDLPVDIEIAAHTFEGQLSIDGAPMPDRLPGPDFTLTYVVPGETEAAVQTYHEGGSLDFSALVPEGRYSVMLNFLAAPDPHLPSMVFNQQLTTSIDLNQEQRLDTSLSTFRIEGGLLIDGRPVRPNPSYNWSLWMFGARGATSTNTALIYEVPMTSSAFSLRAFRNNYFTILLLDEFLEQDLAEGWYVVNRFLEVQGDTQLPINIETQTYEGRLFIDGQPPPENEIAGRLIFRNRAFDAQYSTFFRRIRAAADGSFRVRLPRGEYEVYFQIDNSTFPEHASGTQLLKSRLVLLDSPVVEDVHYDTVLVTGPIRVGGQTVSDSVGGPEVGLNLTRSSDMRTFKWDFEGGTSNYRLRVPAGEYALNFVINRDAFDGVAWGVAPMGQKVSAWWSGEALIPPDR